MASSIPQPFAPRRPASGSSSTPPLSPVQVNSVRLKLVSHRLAVHLSSGASSEEISELCFILARGINYALSNNDVPSGAQQLACLIKQVYEERKSSILGSAISVLMISARNACNNGWFMDADANEILSMANEICSNYCTDANVDTGASKVTCTISKIITRYYPLFKLCRLIFSFEVKPGYNTLMGDFYVQRHIPPREKIVLFVAQTDNLETSSCIISPSQVSFLVNGKAVEKRSNISLDRGPQFPTDITPMVKCGTNIIQAIGYYTGHYTVAIAYVSKITSPSAPVLKDYVQPAVRAATDSEITEGSSRISLRCPISFRRLRKPVKGRLCKHHQCFDYDNFMEMNLRRPSWRCPHCNQPTNCLDLRLDQNLLQILNNVGEDVADVVINATGSWKSAIGESRSADHSHSGTTMRQQDDRMECESNQCSNNQAFVVDLTSEEDGDEGAAFNSRVAEPWNGVTDRAFLNSYGTEDRKHFENSRVFPGSASLAEASSNGRTSFTAQASNGPTKSDIRPRISSSFASNEWNHEDSSLVASALGTLESVIPNSVMNPVMTDAVSPALTRDPATVSIRNSRSTLPFEQEAQARLSSFNWRLQQSHLGNSVTSCQTVRLPVTMHGQGVAVVSQALPALSQTSGIWQMPAADVFRLQSSTTCSGSSSISAQTFSSVISSMLEAIHTQRMLRASDMFPSQPPVQPSVQVFGIPTQNLLGARAADTQQRGFGAYRASLPPPSNILGLQNQMIGRRTNTLTQSSHSPPMQQYTVGRFAANLHASQIASLNPSIVGHLTSGTVSTLSRDHHDGVPASSSQQFLNIVRGTPVMTPQSSLEIQYDQNSQPTGGMRGGLTGSSFSTAPAHYLAQPPSQVLARPSVSSLPFADQF